MASSKLLAEASPGGEDQQVSPLQGSMATGYGDMRVCGSDGETSKFGWFLVRIKHPEAHL